MHKLRRAAFAVTLLAAILAGAPAKRGLPFIEDDYQQALQQARTRKLPLFIEAWAPW